MLRWAFFDAGRFGLLSAVDPPRLIDRAVGWGLDGGLGRGWYLLDRESRKGCTSWNAQSIGAKWVLDRDVDYSASLGFLATVGASVTSFLGFMNVQIPLIFLRLEGRKIMRYFGNSSGLLHEGRFICLSAAHNRCSLRLCDSLNELLPLSVPRPSAINDDILGITRSPTEEVHDYNSISRVSVDKRITRHPNLPYLRETCESRNLCRVRQVVVPKIQSFQRE